MEEKIIPVRPIRSIKEVRAVRPVRLLRRLRYRSKLKKNLPEFLPETAAESQILVEPGDNSQNKAHRIPNI